MPDACPDARAERQQSQEHSTAQPECSAFSARFWQFPMGNSLTVAGNIFTAHVGQVAERSEAQPHNLLVQRIKLTQGGNMEQGAPSELDIALKGTLSWNELTQLMSQPSVFYREVIEPIAQGAQRCNDGLRRNRSGSDVGVRNPTPGDQHRMGRFGLGSVHNNLQWGK